MSDPEHRGERSAIGRSDAPVTPRRLAADLRELGLAAGDQVLVHASLSALGWVPGGAPAVVDALVEAVTRDGTLVMPTHSGQYSDPAAWSNPAVPPEWVDVIRETMPPYRPAVTPTRGMGAVPECFRNYPGARRSRHPNVSFAALGSDAEFVVADHEFDDSLGEGSPLARLYDLDAKVLLLGVDHDRNTSLHLAEYRADYPTERTTNGGPVLVDGERRWIEYEDVEGDTDDFTALGGDFERARPGAVSERTVGLADARLFPQVELVDFAVDWFEAHRTGGS